jgi:tetratricopeptide (TPR) repeat protein
MDMKMNLDDLYSQRVDIYLQISKEKETEKFLKLALSDCEESIKLGKNEDKLSLFYQKRGRIHFQMKIFHQSVKDFEQSFEMNFQKEKLKEIKKEMNFSKIELIKLNYSQVKMPRKSKILKISTNEEIMKLLKDPHIQKCFKNVKKNPKCIKKYLKDEKFKNICDLFMKFFQ